MITINLANAIRLQRRKEEALTILDSEDWTASEDKFKLCAAAIREDFEQVVLLIRRIGRDGDISAGEYRQWPVFIGIREDDRVRKVFEEVFGEDIVEGEIGKAIDNEFKTLNELDTSPS
jgi:hypothetical protein